MITTAVIPARAISSTSKASLRIRWSRYCSEVTAVVNGATKAADTTEVNALGEDEDQQRRTAAPSRRRASRWPTSEIGQRQHRRRRRCAMTTVSSAMPKVRQNCRRVSRKPRPIAPMTPTGSSMSAGTGR